MADLHIYLHLPDTDRKIEEVLTVVKNILKKEIQMSQQMDDLVAQVASNTTVIESALVLIQGLAQALKDAGTDPTKLKALRDSLASEDDKLAAAVAANTNSGGIVVSPATATVAQNATQQFSATGDATGYTWTVNPATGAGTVDANGLYTAPASDGTCTVVATGIADATKSGSASVTF